MVKQRKSRASVRYESPSQMTLPGFETPFSRSLNPNNRWVVLAGLIPWDDICSIYLKHVGVSRTGRPGLSPRVALGSLIIKHICNLDDRETVDQISENIYMQYFLGYSSFSDEPPFDASLFVDLRKRIGMDALNAINEKIALLKSRSSKLEGKEENGSGSDSNSPEENNDNPTLPPTHKGRVILDATACPQDIAYPTDLNLLSEAREMSEKLIDRLYDSTLHPEKPRTYRQVARKRYLQTAQKRNKTRKEIRKAVKSQLSYLGRNIKSIHHLLDAYPGLFPLKKKERKYFYVIQTLYDQQRKMFEDRTHTIEDRIVSIHQPHVRPIVRGKTQAKVEFGSKIHVSIIDGISFLDELSWDAFNEGTHLASYIEKYHQRFGYYPQEVLADQIYCTRTNRRLLKEKGIRLIAKPLGRPSSAVSIHVRPGERNPIEGKFGQAKTGYGLNRIKARLRQTSQTWIAGIFLVLNLVKLAGEALPCLILKWWLCFSAKVARAIQIVASGWNILEHILQNWETPSKKSSNVKLAC